MRLSMLVCASKQRSHKTTALVSEPCWILTKIVFLARSKSLATTLLSPAASSKIESMVEPSVSFMSAFLPKASLLVGLSFAGFYSQQYLKVLGGNLPVRDQMSWRPEHKEAERRRFLNMEREAAPDDPVIMNPFRHNIPATVRNVGDLPSLETGEED